MLMSTLRPRIFPNRDGSVKNWNGYRITAAQPRGIGQTL